MEVEVTTKGIIVFDEAGVYGEYGEVEIETKAVWVPSFGLLWSMPVLVLAATILCCIVLVLIALYTLKLFARRLPTAML